VFDSPWAHKKKRHFCSLKEESKLSWKLLATKFGISNRQFCDWRACRCSFPKSVADFIKTQYNLEVPSEVSVKEDNWHVKDAARKGAQRHFEIYGNFGTSEGRRRGGINSLKTHKIKNTGFFW